MAVDVARVLYAQSEYRQTSSSDQTVLAKDSLSTVLEFKSSLLYAADAVAFMADILSLRKITRFDWVLNLRRKPAYDVIQLGDTVTLSYPRFGLTAGANFIVKSKGFQLAQGVLSLTLFGPQ